MTKLVASVSAIGILLTGCSSNAFQFRPTMGSDQAAIGIEALALLNELQRAYEIDRSNERCFMESIPSLQNAQSESFHRLKEGGESDAAVARRLKCIRFRAGSPEEFQQHLNSGMALADLYRDDYFRRIAVRKQTRQFGRSTTNDMGTAVSVGLGLASAGSIVTGGGGALFGLLDGVYRNYDAAFVVEPDLGKMLKLVKTAQTSFRENVQEKPPLSYADANAAITGYAQFCSYAGMDNLLDVALEAGSDRQTIDEAVAAFQSASSRQEANREQRRAADAEARLEARQRRQAAQQQIDVIDEEERNAGADGVEGADQQP